MKLPNLAGLALAMLSTALPLLAAGLRYQIPDGMTNAYRFELRAVGAVGPETNSGVVLVQTRKVFGDHVSLRFLKAGASSTARPHYADSYWRERTQRLLPSEPEFQQALGSQYAELVIDSRGGIVRKSGDIDLLIPFGGLMESLFPVLPGRGGRSTEQRQVTLLGEPHFVGPGAYLYAQPQQQSGSPGFFNSPVSPRIGTRPKIYSALQMDANSVTSEDRIPKLKTERHVETVLQGLDRPLIVGDSTAEYAFDPETLMPVSVEINGRLQSETPSQTLLVKLTLKWIRLSSSEAERLSPAISGPGPTPAGQPVPSAVVSPPPPRPKLTRAEVVALSGQILSETDNRYSALNKLITHEITEEPPELLRALRAAVKDANESTRQHSVRLLVPRATKEDMPVLLDLFSDSNFVIRNSAVDGLKRLKDPQAVTLLVDYIAANPPAVRRSTFPPSSGEMTAEEGVLVAIGPAAETAVRTLLYERAVGARISGCRVLQKIGGRGSLDPLYKLVEVNDAELSNAAAAAIREIASRAP